CNLTHPTPEELIHKFALIDRYCEALGRDAREIRRTIYVKGFVGATDAEAMEQAQHASKKFSLDQQRIRGLLGSPETIRQRLRELEQLGVQEVIVLLHGVIHHESLRLLAQCLTR
ncbi:MAG: LLM class flavin-dependent oxidoreductase, partial [Ktedonobacteraceae bacterium]|nr:LLM class flavin-dependent oxidoreductase [Ktedonobacteraceae bacterium]